MCIRITVFWSFAIVAGMLGSREPPDTSLMISAPALTAASATAARYVSMLMATLLASGRERISLIAGRTRESSTSSVTGSQSGRVLSPPTSIIVAPSRMNVRMVSVKDARSVGECFPPSEKESGVTFRVAIRCVLRLGSEAQRGGNCGDSGVTATGAGFEGGRESRYD
ncbi:hypothetical protein ACKS0A_09884 [Histoplasma ohiense]